MATATVDERCEKDARAWLKWQERWYGDLRSGNPWVEWLRRTIERNWPHE